MDENQEPATIDEVLDVLLRHAEVANKNFGVINRVMLQFKEHINSLNERVKALEEAAEPKIHV